MADGRPRQGRSIARRIGPGRQSGQNVSQKSSTTPEIWEGRRPSPAPPTFGLVLIGIVLWATATGCVQRRMLIHSSPEGALVSVDRQVVGHTPVSVPFTYYGTREIELQKDGYQTTRVKQRIRPPFYELFPLSFFSENLALRERRDVRVLDFELKPREAVNESQLLERGSQLRQDVCRGTVAAPLH